MKQVQNIVSFKYTYFAILMMCIVIASSNYLVTIPVHISFGHVNLADLLTWGTLSFPVAFLITDLTNRQLGAKQATIVVFVGFIFGVLLSIFIATPRIAIASGSAFLIAQLLDVTIFNRLRNQVWWRAPLVSSFVGSVVDTTLFYGLAFAAGFAFLDVMTGITPDMFPTESSAFIAFTQIDAPRWISWAFFDFLMKMLVALFMLVPYSLIIGRTKAIGEV